jgi:hypothetical protein
MNLRFATANENKTLHAFSTLTGPIFTRDTKTRSGTKKYFVRLRVLQLSGEKLLVSVALCVAAH